MTSSRTLLVMAGLLASACISPKPAGTGTGTTGSTTDSGGTGGGTAATIADIRQGKVSENTLLTLTDVIVTSPLTQDGAGFTIQDAGGGAYSGIYVYLQGTFDGLFLEVGDKITISGTYAEYYDFSELTVTATTSITVTGTGDVAVTSLTDDQVASPTDMEQWESVLVSLDSQTFLSCPNNYGEVALSSGLTINDLYYAYDVDRNATVSQILGVIEYSFKEYKLDPRSIDDLVGFTAGDGCTYTPAEIHDQAAENPDSLGTVEMSDLVVTSGPTQNGTPGFFVQSQGGGEKSGMFIYLYKDVDPAALDLSIGDVIDLSGTASVYYDMTEVAVYDAADIVKTGATATVVADTLTEAPTDWNFWEGALVTMTSVEALGAVDSYGECETDWGVYLDDAFTSYTASTGTTWDSVTGEVSYSYGNTLVLPRDADDLNGANVVTTSATIHDIQQGTVPVGTAVELDGVIATSGPTAAGDGFFVEDAGGGVYSGIYVFKDKASWTVAAGDKLSIVGTVNDYFGMTQIVVGNEADVTVTGSATPSPTVLTSAPSDWAPYSGVLVTLNGPVGVTSDVDSYGEVTLDWGISMDNLIYNFSVNNGDSLSSATGPIYYSYKEWKLCPRSDADLGL